ncbi:MAG: hypothetical protein AABX70_02075 [Nanoarchaeota archaeon]
MCLGSFDNNNGNANDNNNLDNNNGRLVGIVKRMAGTFFIVKNRLS